MQSSVHNTHTQFYRNTAKYSMGFDCVHQAYRFSQENTITQFPIET